VFFLKASIINLNTIRPIYNSLDDHISGPKRIGVTLLIAVSTCIFSLGCALILWSLDIRRRRLQCEDNPNDAGSLYFLSTHPESHGLSFSFQPTNFAFKVSMHFVLFENIFFTMINRCATLFGFTLLCLCCLCFLLCGHIPIHCCRTTTIRVQIRLVTGMVECLQQFDIFHVSFI
jgi:hypothetical protein